MLSIDGSAKEIADLLQELAGRQTQEVKLGLDGEKIVKGLLGATHDTSAKESE